MEPTDTPTPRNTRASWRVSKPAFISRVLLGLLLISGGINNFLVRIPVATPTPEAVSFLAFLHETGYLLQAVAITEITVGLLLLSGYFLPLALVLFAPILVNIALFHLFIQFCRNRDRPGGRSSLLPPRLHPPRSLLRGARALGARDRESC